ncbi:hypothetical protein V2J09_021333 [Rumex salicifolius]
MSLQLLQLPVASLCNPILTDGASVRFPQYRPLNCKLKRGENFTSSGIWLHFIGQVRHRRRLRVGPVLVGGTEVLEGNQAEENDDELEPEPSPDDMECIAQIKRVLELLKRNRNMLYGEVKLTILIEDPREVERRRLLGIDDADAPTKEDLADALEDVNEGRVPKNRVALRMLTEEMINWPNLEVEISKKRPKTRSPYAKATDVGVDPEVAAKRLNMDWDTAAEIGEEGAAEERDVPSILGFGALYLVSAFPIIIGVSVVLILFYNSLQNEALLKRRLVTISSHFDIVTMPPARDLEIILTDDHPRESYGSLSDGDDMFLTIDTLDNDFPVVERPRALVKKESMQQEKQVSVDPMSLMGSTIRQASFKLVSTPPRHPRSQRESLPSPLPPPKLKFVSSSLPSSASSSPRSYSSLSKMASPGCPQPHQNWAMDDNDLALQEYNMRKSRSEGEGRASAFADDFNIMPSIGGGGGAKYNDFSSFSKPVMGYEDAQSTGAKHGDEPEDKFKCGKLCLFLPRGGKGKTVRASSSNSISSMASRMSSLPSSHKSNRMPPIPSHKADPVSSNRSLKMDLPVISKRMSLERFDLGSFSSLVTSDDEAEESTSLFFDLPLEMIRYSVSEVQSPVTAAFVFEKEAKMENDPTTDATRSLSPQQNWRDNFST